MTIEIVWKFSSGRSAAFTIPASQEYNLDSGAEKFFGDLFGVYDITGIEAFLRLLADIDGDVKLMGDITLNTLLVGDIDLTTSLRGEY